MVRRWRELSPLGVADANAAAVESLRAAGLTRSPTHTARVLEVITACDKCHAQQTFRGTPSEIVTAAKAWSQTHPCTTQPRTPATGA